MAKITINCDMGEAFGIYRFGDDETCMPFVTHANIACGFHASDPVGHVEDRAGGQAARASRSARTLACPTAKASAVAR